MERRDLEAEISLLIDEVEGEQGDRHEIYLAYIPNAGFVPFADSCSV
jgi:hypothetical protein